MSRARETLVRCIADLFDELAMERESERAELMRRLDSIEEKTAEALAKLSSLNMAARRRRPRT